MDVCPKSPMKLLKPNVSREQGSRILFLLIDAFHDVSTPTFFLKRKQIASRCVNLRVHFLT